MTGVQTCALPIYDEYEIREYERKTALKLEDKPFSFPQDVREGDAYRIFKEVGTQYSRASGGKRHKAKCHIRKSATGNKAQADDAF